MTVREIPSKIDGPGLYVIKVSMSQLSSAEWVDILYDSVLFLYYYVRLYARPVVIHFNTASSLRAQSIHYYI